MQRRASRTTWIDIPPNTQSEPNLANMAKSFPVNGSGWSLASEEDPTNQGGTSPLSSNPTTVLVAQMAMTSRFPHKLQIGSTPFGAPTAQCTADVPQYAKIVIADAEKHLSSDATLTMTFFVSIPPSESNELIGTVRIYFGADSYAVVKFAAPSPQAVRQSMTVQVRCSSRDKQFTALYLAPGSGTPHRRDSLTTLTPATPKSPPLAVRTPDENDSFGQTHDSNVNATQVTPSNSPGCSALGPSNSLIHSDTTPFRPPLQRRAKQMKRNCEMEIIAMLQVLGAELTILHVTSTAPLSPSTQPDSSTKVCLA